MIMMKKKMKKEILEISKKEKMMKMDIKNQKAIMKAKIMMIINLIKERTRNNYMSNKKKQKFKKKKKRILKINLMIYLQRVSSKLISKTKMIGLTLRKKNLNK